jgi:menaquinone-dependent protoporphyrinogen oxidase
MPTLIVFRTTHGFTEKAVQLLMTGMKDDTTVVNLLGDTDPEISGYDRIIIGGSIHMGEIQKEIRNFCIHNIQELLTKKIGLFLCCMFEGDVEKKQFEDAFPAELRAHASATGFFGGGISFEKMNMMEKLIVKKVAKIDQNVTRLRTASILDFARQMSS